MRHIGKQPLEIITILAFIFISLAALTSCGAANASAAAVGAKLDVSSPDNVYAALDDAYSHKAEAGLCPYPTGFMEEIKTYLSAKAPAIYNEAFWPVQEIENFGNLQRVDCTLAGKRAAVIVFQEGPHLQYYLMYEKPNNGAWLLTGLAAQNDRFLNDYGQCDFYIAKYVYGGDNYWLVLKTEVDHGTNLSIFNQIWYNPDGTEALQYQASGDTLLFCGQDENNEWHSAGMNFDSRFNLSATDAAGAYVYVSYDVNFTYPGDSLLPVHRAFDYAMYVWNPETKRFVLNESESSLKPVDTATGMPEWALISNKYKYRGEGPVTSLDEFLKLF